MQFRIRTKDITASGREIVRERDVEAAELGIGRAAENAIHLPDLAVEQRHLLLTHTPGGSISAKALGRLGFTHDGRKVMAAAIDPARGGEIGLGSYLIAITQEEGGLTVITVQRMVEKEGGTKDRLRGFSLGGTLPGKRAMAWTAFVAILAAFLAVPIWTHLNRPEAEPSIRAQGAVKWDAAWSTGPLSAAHHGLENNCEACHAEPFVAVQDKTCLTCHQDIADHAEMDRLADGREPYSSGDALLWRVAQAFGKPGPGACTDCHTEHEGAGRMQPTAQQFCADCHNTMDTRLTDTALGNASDFGKLHPQFKALVYSESGAAEPVRMSLASNVQVGNPRDWNGLRFPHDEHLSKTNGVARMAARLGAAQGYGDALECKDCHTPTADGVRFLPVNMEANCEACHSLVYDQVGTTFRSLRHGNIDAMQADLMAADRAPRRPVTTGRMRPGEFSEGGLYYGNFSSVSPRSLRANVMQPEGLCGECHLPAVNGGPLDVMPVRQTSRFFSHGWFDHAAHTQEDCTTCHAAETSSSAADLLLPGVKECRDCHLGEASKTAEVPSSCAMCHSYHPRSGPAAAPPRIATGPNQLQLGARRP